MSWDLHVSGHAVTRARERFGANFSAAEIASDVSSALSAGRVSTSKPPGLLPPDDPGCLYAWTSDLSRAYAFSADATGMDRFVVATSMAPDPRTSGS